MLQLSWTEYTFISQCLYLYGCAFNDMEQMRLARKEKEDRRSNVLVFGKNQELF